MTAEVESDYVAECFLPGARQGDLSALDERAARWAARLARSGRTIRYLGSCYFTRTRSSCACSPARWRRSARPRRRRRFRSPGSSPRPAHRRRWPSGASDETPAAARRNRARRPPRACLPRPRDHRHRDRVRRSGVRHGGDQPVQLARGRVRPRLGLRPPLARARRLRSAERGCRQRRHARLLPAELRSAADLLGARRGGGQLCGHLRRVHQLPARIDVGRDPANLSVRRHRGDGNRV
jgi:hypothetical protein